MNNKAKIVLITIIIITVIALVAYNFSLSITGGVARVTPVTEGKVSVDIFISPDKPRILQKMEIRAVVASNVREDLFLELIVVEDGKTNKYQSYQFSLGEGDSSEYKFTYTPTSIKKQNIVANLYNSDKTTLFDSKIIEFTPESDIGPFDVEIDLPTNFVPKGKELPVTVKMINFGSKDVDVNLVADILCFKEPNIRRDLFLKINSSSDLEKNLIMPTCNEEGQHSIKAALVAYGEEHVSAKSQYFERDFLKRIDYLVPDTITVAENSSREVNIIYKNEENVIVTDIKPFVFGIPSSWFTITPSFVPSIKRGDSTVAIIKFSIPENTEGTYPILIGVSGHDL